MSKLSNLVVRAGLVASALALATPVLAAGFASPPDTAVTFVPPEYRLTIGGVFTHAKPLIMLIFAGLIVATAYGAFVYLRGLTVRRGQPVGGLTFLSATSVGGPMIGALGAAYGLLDMCIGISNKRPPATLVMLAPGYAEAMLCLTLGLLAGAVALVGHRHLTGRMQPLAAATPAAPESPATHLARAMG